MDSLLNLKNLIGLKIQNENSVHVHANAQKLGTVRVVDPWWRPEGSRALGTSMINSNTVALLTQRKSERLGANLTLLGTKKSESLDTKS